MMAYNEILAQRVHEILQTKGDFLEMKMFGGIAFMHNGNMALGVLHDELIVRVGLEKYEAALRQPGTDLFGPTGKPMAGWIVVKPSGYQDEDALNKWIDLGLTFVKTLPAK
jgi:TfoX/Sxy family transcriptional regulator of competence genes